MTTATQAAAEAEAVFAPEVKKAADAVVQEAEEAGAIMAAIQQIIEIDDERKALTDDRNQVVKRLCERFSLDKASFNIALKRYKMAREDSDKARHFDHSLNVCLNAVMVQGDLFEGPKKGGPE